MSDLSGSGPLQSPSDETLQALQYVTKNLQKLYREHLLPVEKEFLVHQFGSSELTEDSFSACPMVVVIGPYSTGKSSFIRHLLRRDYPGLNIGPEPTTDRFVATLYGDRDERIPGNAVVADRSLPFSELHIFGNSFLERFEVARLTCPVLKNLTIVDTPGVLACDKDRLHRGYAFEDVARWFAERSDLVLLFFDVTKMTISDELQQIIIAVKGNGTKLRIILNKADQVSSSQLMRIYGAMLWSLKDVLNTLEVVRVYMGSFWNEPLRHDDLRRLFENEENDIYTDFAELPRRVALRRLNDVVMRARLAKAQACVLDWLRKHLGPGAKLSSLCGRSMQQRTLLANLGAHYDDIAMEYKISAGDLPEVEFFREKLANTDFTTLPMVKPGSFKALDNMLTTDVPKLLQLISDESAMVGLADVAQVGKECSPFSVMHNGAQMTNTYENEWLTPPVVEEYRKAFDELGPVMGKLDGKVAKGSMIQSKLPSKVLHQIWTLADVDKDGSLTLPEYALAMHFIKMKQEGITLPGTLPQNMKMVTGGP